MVPETVHEFKLIDSADWQSDLTRKLRWGRAFSTARRLLVPVRLRMMSTRVALNGDGGQTGYPYVVS